VVNRHSILQTLEQAFDPQLLDYGSGHLILWTAV